MIEYKTVFLDAGKKIDGLEKFDELVNEHCQQGWIPCGGIHSVGSALYIAMSRPKNKTLLG